MTISVKFKIKHFTKSDGYNKKHLILTKLCTKLPLYYVLLNHIVYNAIITYTKRGYTIIIA